MAEVVEEAGKQAQAAEKAKRERSPSFPFIPLKTAIQRLVAFEEYFKRHPAPLEKAALAWQMKPGSSQAGQTTAALKAFGLLEYQGGNAAISDEGRTYLRAQQDEIKRAVLKRAAIRPKAIDRYWQDWGADRPPEALCLDQLVLSGGYTEAAARLFLRVYDETIDYAGLADSDKSERVDSEETGRKDPPPAAAVVGDLVQVDIGGTLQLEKPARVRAVREHDGEAWIFVEGSETGIPMSQVVIEARGASEGAKQPSPPPTLPLDKAPSTEGALRLQASEREWLRGPLSRGTEYRLIVSGDLGPKEIGKLIKLLEAQKEVLADDEE